MNSNYIRFLIKSGIKAATGIAALAAAALILKSDNVGNREHPKTEQPKPEKPTAPEPPKAPTDNSAFQTAQEPQTPEKTVPSKSEQSCVFPDEFYPTQNDIYVPDSLEAEKAEVPFIELTEKQAVEQGWSFRKKSKSVRITNYHGKERDIIVPSKIGGKRVNELSAYAFRAARIERIQIPSSIIKVGKGLFMVSTVREAIFGSGLRVIPKEAFYNCKELNRVILPDTVFEIGEYAFNGCRSLEYIRFPDNLFKVREYAFKGSGLRGFSMRYPMRLNNGGAFLYTPLHKMYKIIAAKNDNDHITVLLVGEKAKIKFPKKRVSFREHSIYTDCSLDLSGCANLDFQNAVDEQRFFWGNTKIVVRRGQEGYFFGEKADVKYTDGSPYPKLLIPIEQDGDHLTVRFTGIAFRNGLIPSRHVYFGVKSLKITGKVFMQICDNAFDDPKLERLDIDYYFGSNGEIFSFNCVSLREFRWKGRYNKGQYVHYIPPAAAVSVNVHRGLLKAFRSPPQKYEYDMNARWFFDSSVIDKIFQDKCLELPYRCPKIRQRQLIPIAIDILRSSPELYPDGTEKYARFLRRHLKYAKKCAEKISGEYPEYKEFLAEFK